MSLYHNKQLGERLAQCGVVDQTVRFGPMTFEAELTLTIQTDATGIVHICLSLDLVTIQGVSVLGVPLAIYPLPHQADAMEDARLIASQWGLDVRRATELVGWEHIVSTKVAGPQPAVDFDFKV